MDKLSDRVCHSVLLGPTALLLLWIAVMIWESLGAVLFAVISEASPNCQVSSCSSERLETPVPTAYCSSAESAGQKEFPGFIYIVVHCPIFDMTILYIDDA